MGYHETLTGITKSD